MPNPQCPVCGNLMVSNLAGKQKNAKAPDWKCSDRNCKFQFDKQTKNWVVSDYITSIWNEPQQGAETPVPSTPSATYHPTKEAMGQRKEFQNTMDYKAQQIGKSQAAKEDSMRLFSSGRDAVLVTVAEMNQGSGWSEDEIKAKIKEWNKFFYDNIYNEKPFVG